jgi:hypothetical protein
MRSRFRALATILPLGVALLAGGCSSSLAFREGTLGGLGRASRALSGRVILRRAPQRVAGGSGGPSPRASTVP